MATIQAFWRFSRPHTIIGTTLSVWAVYLLTILGDGNSVNSPASLDLVFGAWLACLLGNVYIVGLNQLWDVDIDRINKPNLPLANGDFSIAQGRWIVGLCGVASLAIAWGLGLWLGLTVGISLIIGTAYSVPPVRLKRFSLLAALCILTVRGIVVNLGLFLFFRIGLGYPPTLITPIWVLTLFILVFTVAIAIFKDVPDMEGDRQFKIQTLTLQIGKQNVFRGTLILLTGCYLAMAIWGLWAAMPLNTAFLIVSHLCLLALLWWRSRDVHLESKTEIASFYQFIWKLFFLEYLLYPLALWLPNFSNTIF
ncbi:slr1736 [Synechocystis sp. PCC 6803]|uniref:Homogentisate phytyltransferase n=2 Tax=root TaxID=1 RepID=HGGT_SYNY3|nr:MULTISPECIES: homogentisate phytyltransferase [unclassified Synechocystis]P73726.1 RecName: Full=Homogentisate phytyltransferase; Short=HPT [Synechocystis sp. PCC 6803 substr. Kazusa]AFQ99308.1 homogentisate phytyl transferase [Chloroplast transformation vector pSyHPT]AFQ99320.1 homogentisate phytyl transferase [Chloroplast transformation vector pTop1]AFQ99328.1 homogentisate phytyl transferase [Chloroplast transformation vector pTop2]AVZ65966.1 Aro8 [unidentified]BAM51526.1 tocopherol phy